MILATIGGSILSFAVAFALARRGAISLGKGTGIILVASPLGVAAVFALMIAVTPEVARTPTEQFVFVVAALAPVSLSVAVAAWLGSRSTEHAGRTVE